MNIRSALIVLLLLAVACSSKVATTTTSSSANGGHNEDLSLWRPRDIMPKDSVSTPSANQAADVKKPLEPVEAKFAVNNDLDAVLDSISRINLANGHIDGFTIQVYSGTKREEALNAKKELSVSLPELDSEVQYVQPNFRVRVGKYYDRLLAQKDFMLIKRHFPNAIVIPERIAIQ